jgi:hypothetical protein
VVVEFVTGSCPASFIIEAKEREVSATSNAQKSLTYRQGSAKNSELDDALDERRKAERKEAIEFIVSRMRKYSITISDLGE